LLIASPLALRSATESPAAPAIDNAGLSGKTIVLAGRLPAMTAAEASVLIERAGGMVATRVPRATVLLVAGARPAAQLEAAPTLGIRVIDGMELRRMLGLSVDAPEEKRQE